MYLKVCVYYLNFIDEKLRTEFIEGMEMNNRRNIIYNLFANTNRLASKLIVK